MSTTATEPFSVFLSHSIGIREEASRIARALSDAGLDVFDPGTMEVSSTWKDDLWKGLVESDAIVVIADSRQMTSANVAVELGAARAWQKPIFVIRTDDASISAPLGYLEHLPTYPKSRLADVVTSIRQQAAPLAQADRAALIAAYRELGVPTDSLMTDPSLVDELLHRFHSRSKSPLSGERLVQELIRMRKAGILPGLRKQK